MALIVNIVDIVPHFGYDKKIIQREGYWCYSMNYV